MADPLYKRVTDFINRGGNPQREGETNAVSPDVEGFYKRNNGSYTRDPVKATSVTLDSDGNIVLNVPQKYENDEGVQKILDNALLTQISKNYKIDKNVQYQSPTDETKKINTENYLKLIEEAAQSEIATAEAIAPTQAWLISEHGGSEDKNDVIMSLNRENMIVASTSATNKNDNDDSPVALPKWLIDEYPEIEFLDSYTNGFVKKKDFLENFYSSQKGMTDYIALKIAKKAQGVFDHIEDMDADELSRSIAFATFLSKNDPTRTDWESFLRSADDWSAAGMAAFSETLFTALDTVVNFAVGVASLGYTWHEGMSIDMKDNFIIKGFEQDLKSRAEVDALIDKDGLNTLEASYVWNGRAAALAEAAVIAVTFGEISSAAQNAIIAKGGAKVGAEAAKEAAVTASGAEDLARIGKSVSGSTIKATASGTVFSNLLGKLGGPFSAKFARFASVMNVAHVSFNSYMKSIGIMEASLASMSSAGLVNVINAAYRVTQVASLANTAIGVLSSMTIAALVRNSELTNKVMRGEKTSPEVWAWLGQVAFDTAKLEAESAALGFAYGQISKTAWFKAAKLKASKASVKVKTIFADGYNKYQQWYQGVKTTAQQKFSKGGLTNAQVASNDALFEAIVRNDIDKVWANKSTTQSAAGTMGVRGAVGVVDPSGQLTEYENFSAVRAEADNVFTKDINSVYSQWFIQLSDPNINPRTSKGISSWQKSTNDLLKKQEEEGLLNKDALKANKELKKNSSYDFEVTFSFQSHEVAVYGMRYHEYLHVIDKLKASGVNVTGNEPVLVEAIDRLNAAGKSLSPELKELTKKHVEIISQLSHDINDFAMNKGLLPEEIIAGIRSKGEWGEDGVHWAPRLSKKEAPEGYYIPLDGTTHVESVIDLHNDRIMEDEEILSLDTGLRNYIYNLARAELDKQKVDVARKVDGAVIETTVTGETSAAMKKVAQYKTEFSSSVKRGIKSFKSDLEKTNSVGKKNELLKKYSVPSTVSKEIIEYVSGVDALDIVTLRVKMNDAGILTASDITDINTFLDYYDDLCDQAKKELELSLGPISVRYEEIRDVMPAYNKYSQMQQNNPSELDTIMEKVDRINAANSYALAGDKDIKDAGAKADEDIKELQDGNTNKLGEEYRNSLKELDDLTKSADDIKRQIADRSPKTDAQGFIPTLKYKERKRLAQKVSDSNPGEYALLYRMQGGKPDQWRPNNRGKAGKFEGNIGELKGAVWLTSDPNWVEGPERATAGVEEKYIDGGEYAKNAKKNDSRNIEGYEKFGNDNLERLSEEELTPEEEAFSLNFIKPGGAIDYFNGLRREGFYKTPRALAEAIIESFQNGDLGYYESEFETPDEVIESITYDYFPEEQQSIHEQYLGENSGIDENDPDNDTLAREQLYYGALYALAVDKLSKIVTTGNYRLTNPTILHRGISTGGNSVNKGADFSWAKEGKKFNDNGLAFVSLSEDVAKGFAQNGKGDKYVLDYYLPRDTQLFYFGNIKKGMGSGNGGAFVLPPMSGAKVGKITTDADGVKHVQILFKDSLYISPSTEGVTDENIIVIPVKKSDIYDNTYDGGEEYKDDAALKKKIEDNGKKLIQTKATERTDAIDSARKKGIAPRNMDHTNPKNASRTEFILFEQDHPEVLYDGMNKMLDVYNNELTKDRANQRAIKDLERDLKVLEDEKDKVFVSILEKYAELEEKASKTAAATKKTATSKKGKGSTKKYDIDDAMLNYDVDSAIDGLIGYVAGSKEIDVYFDGLSVAKGFKKTGLRIEYEILSELLSDSNKELLSKTINSIAETIVRESIPYGASVIAGNIEQLPKRLAAKIYKRLVDRLGNAKTTLESMGEKADSATVDSLLKKWDEEMTGYKQNDNYVRTTDRNGNVEILKVTPAWGTFLNNRPVYKPASIPREILRTLALVKRISLTNVNPRTPAKQTFTDTAMSWATVGSIPLPGICGLTSKSIAASFGQQIADQMKVLDPFRYQIILDIAERDGITISEAIRRNTEAIFKSELPFTTMSREALTQGSEARYGVDTALNRTPRGFFDRLRGRLIKTSERLGKPNDIREMYTRQAAGLKAQYDALRNGFNYQQAEIFRLYAVNNATTNFRRKSIMFNSIRDTTPYVVAGISGAKSFWNMFNFDPIGVSARIFNGFIVPYIFLLSEVEDDDTLREKYEALAESEKQNHIILAFGKDVVRIPVGEEIGSIIEPFRHLVEWAHGESKYTFWSLVANDIVGYYPLDLTGFTDLDMWNSVTGEPPSFLEVMENGFSKMAAQTAPPIIQSAIMASTGRDLYSGKKINKSNVKIDNEGNAVIESYSQSEFAKALAKNVGGDAKVIEKVTSGIFGTTALHVLDTVTSAVQYVKSGGKEGSLTTAFSKTAEDLGKPFAIYGYGSLEKQWSQEVSSLFDKKKEIENSDAYKEYNKKISKTSDVKERQKYINKRNELFVDYQKRVQALLIGYRDAGGELNGYKFSVAASLLAFEDALRADRAFMDINTNYLDARAQALETLHDYGITNPEGVSMLGYIYFDDDGKEQLKLWNPAQMQIIANSYYEQGDIHAAHLKAIIDDGTENSLKKLGQVESNAEDVYWNKNKMTNADYDAIDDLRKEYNAKVILAIKDYIDSYGAAYVLSNEAVMDYLENVIKVPSSYEKVNGRFVSAGGGKLNKQQGFVRSYIKQLFGV